MSQIIRSCLKYDRLTKIPNVPALNFGTKIGFGIGLGLGFGYSCVMAEEMGHVFKGANLEGGQVHRLNQYMNSIVTPTRNFGKDLETLTQKFMLKTDIGNENMSSSQFRRWLQFYLKENLDASAEKLWETAFQLDLGSFDFISVDELRMGYAFIRTMKSKKIKKKDLPIWSKYTFAAMDSEKKGFLDFDAISFWIGFVIRTGFVNNRHPSGHRMTNQEMADLVFKKYDADGDGTITEDEFGQIFYDLLCGKFSIWHPTA